MQIMSANNASRIPDSVDNIVIDTGNLLALEAFKRKASILPTEEIVEGITAVINHCHQNGNLKIDSNLALLTNTNISPTNTERETTRIIVKIFTFDFSDCETFANAIDMVLKQLNTDTIDSLILSLPARSSKLTLDEIKPIWRCAESIVSNGKASQLGISDLDTNQLAQLYEWAEDSKPTTNHINLDVCCVIPPEMTAYAKEHNIQLLTHNDPKDFMPEDRLRSIMSELFGEFVDSWKRSWIARYSVIITGKGILQNKGYILSAKKLS